MVLIQLISTHQIRGATTITLTPAAESSSRIQLMWTQLPSAVNYKYIRILLLDSHQALQMKLFLLRQASHSMAGEI